MMIDLQKSSLKWLLLFPSVIPLITIEVRTFDSAYYREILSVTEEYRTYTMKTIELSVRFRQQSNQAELTMIC